MIPDAIAQLRWQFVQCIEPVLIAEDRETFAETAEEKADAHEAARGAREKKAVAYRAYQRARIDALRGVCNE